MTWTTYHKTQIAVPKRETSICVFFTQEYATWWGVLFTYGKRKDPVEIVDAVTQA
jgi:hypothetical protein